MKVSLGSSDMGVSAHLQSSKAGTTRFFTSNTHSSVVLQVSRSFELLFASLGAVFLLLLFKRSASWKTSG